MRAKSTSRLLIDNKWKIFFLSSIDSSVTRGNVSSKPFVDSCSGLRDIGILALFCVYKHIFGVGVKISYFWKNESNTTIKSILEDVYQFNISFVFIIFLDVPLLLGHWVGWFWLHRFRLGNVGAKWSYGWILVYWWVL